MKLIVNTHDKDFEKYINDVFNNRNIENITLEIGETIVYSDPCFYIKLDTYYITITRPDFYYKNSNFVNALIDVMLKINELTENNNNL